MQSSVTIQEGKLLITATKDENVMKTNGPKTLDLTVKISTGARRRRRVQFEEPLIQQLQPQAEAMKRQENERLEIAINILSAKEAAKPEELTSTLSDKLFTQTALRTLPIPQKFSFISSISGDKGRNFSAYHSLSPLAGHMLPCKRNENQELGIILPMFGPEDSTSMMPWRQKQQTSVFYPLPENKPEPLYDNNLAASELYHISPAESGVDITTLKPIDTIPDTKVSMKPD